MSTRIVSTGAMARRMRALARQSLSALVRLGRPAGHLGPQPFEPCFDAACRVLLRLPQAAAGGEAAEGIDAAALASSRACLQSGRRPRFFADAQELAAAARRAGALHPHWRERTLARVQEDRGQGLRLYGERGPVLRAGFPWGAVPAGPGGDVLHSVRPHRFAFAPRWALAILYGEPLAGEFLGIVEDWMRFAAGRDNRLAYLSNLVVIQRLLSTTWAWAYLGACEAVGEEHRRLEWRLLQIVATDLEFLRPRLGHSHPNNHLLVDRFAGWFAAVLWPEPGPDPTARDRHEQAWLAEWERQTLPDGAGFEHAQHYHEFACEMAVAYLALSRRNGLPLDPRALQRTQAMLRFQADANGGAASPLAFGNGTEDPLFPLDAGEGWGSAALRDVLAAWFEPLRGLPPDDRVDRERAYWLLGGGANAEPFAAGVAGASASGAAGASGASGAASDCAVYPDGGIVVLPDSDPATRLVLRTGPAPGRALCGGHAHADLLSVYVDVDAVPLVVDAGTFSYRGAKAPWAGSEPAWRRYFAGPAAHNGLAIDGADPLGALDGDFRPNDLAASIELRSCQVGGRLRHVEAAVCGGGPYAGHRRGVLHVLDRYWLVYDLVPARGTAAASFGFQTAPETATHALDDQATALELDRARLVISHAAGLSAPQVLRGQTTPPAGWVSPAYGCKVPAAQLRYGWTGECAVTAFVLTAGGAARPREIEAIGAADGGCAFRLRFDDRVDHLLASERPHGEAWSAFGIRLSGAALLWSASNDGSGRLDWVDGRSLEVPGWRVRARAPGGLARLGGRVGAGGIEWDEGMEGELVCESWMQDERSPKR